MFTSPITETADALYHSPIKMKHEWILLGLMLIVGAFSTVYFEKMHISFLLIWSVSIIFHFARRYRQFKRYGPLGPPSVSVANQTLYIARPQDSQGGVSIALPELERVVIYGQTGRRILRLQKRNQSFLDVTPQWSTMLEQRAIQFLQRALAQQVTVESPQSMFAAVRGDGPNT